MKQFTATIAVQITNMNMDTPNFLKTKWICLPLTEEEIEEELEEIFDEGEPRSYTFIDFESTIIHDLREHADEFDDIEELNELAEIIDDMQDYQREALPLVLSQVNRVAEAVEIVDRIEYMILDNVANEEDLGIEIVRMDAFHSNIPVELEPYIDYGRIGQDEIDNGTWSLVKESKQAIAITL